MCVCVKGGDGVAPKSECNICGGFPEPIEILFTFRINKVIYLNDLFFLVDYTEVCNFADDTTFFAYVKDLGSLINRLEHDSFLAIE